MGFTVTEVEEESEQDPYTNGTALVARTLGELLNEPGASQPSNINADYVAYAETLWRKARSVLLWWTPARIEEQALRRAGDSIGPSTIAQEHHLFMAVYLRWAGLLWQWAPHVAIGNIASGDTFTQNLLVKRALMLNDAIAELLRGLERKGVAAESRAMDIRLRIDHDRIAQLIAGQDLVMHLQRLVEIAAQSAADQEHLRALADDLAPDIQKATKALGSMENAADYACDKLARLEPEKRGKLRTLTAALMAASLNAGTKLFLERLLQLLSR